MAEPLAAYEGRRFLWHPSINVREHAGDSMSGCVARGHREIVAQFALPALGARRSCSHWDVVSRLYRFRWQIELCFKEWKSYANLHQFDTGNPHIAAGLIWASLCAAVLKRFLAHAAQQVGRGRAVSTRRVAMCAHHVLKDLVAALLAGVGLLAILRRSLAYLLANARRSNSDRDRRRGRLRAGLLVASAA